MQSFILPANGQATPKSIERKRKMAEAMLAQGVDYSPIASPWQGAARMANALVGGLGQRKADKQEAEGTASAREAMIKALNGGDNAAVMEAATNPFADSNSMAFLGKRWEQLNPGPPDPYTLGPGELRFENGQEVARGLPKTADTAIYNNVQTGGEVPDGELRKKLQGFEGEAWGDAKKAATVSSGTAQDMELIDELIDMAPQGPIQGRLAEFFPGFSSAGSAFESIVKRVAPTLRAPGSGATSDIEYDGMLKSLPALRNRPEANRLISQMMKAKAAVNMERGAIVDAYSSGKIDAPEARSRMDELDRKSIITPEMRRLFAGVVPESANPELKKKYGLE